MKLRDPTVAPEAATLLVNPKRRASKNDSPFWIRVPESAVAGARLGDLMVREAHLPQGVPVKIGDTTLTLEPDEDQDPLPEQPSGVRPWLTRSGSGVKTLWMVKKAASTPLSIYLAGETGTGKEVLAHLVHAWSDRAKGPFVPLHCGALSLSLVESELFGHVKGAFTGAIHQRPGALMQAHNGTLFLDEVGDLPLDVQVKLLRFLENGEIRPVGADHLAHANVRIICATHHPLHLLVEQGKFRRDLYYRLASVTIEIPSLRSRPRDIELLSREFAAQLGRTISRQALCRLKAHAWPGNVRELRHAIERASGLSGPFSPFLEEEAFEFLSSPENLTEQDHEGAILSLEEMERYMIIKALKLAEGHRGRAAKILGIARSTMFEMLKRHRIVSPSRAQVQLEYL